MLNVHELLVVGLLVDIAVAEVLSEHFLDDNLALRDTDAKVLVSFQDSVVVVVGKLAHELELAGTKVGCGWYEVVIAGRATCLLKVGILSIRPLVRLNWVLERG